MVIFERLWSLFGTPDLGPVDFDTLERRVTPNDALASPPGFCKARADLTSPAFRVDVTSLRCAMTKVIATEPRTTLVEHDDSTLTERYIQRSAFLSFPDTIAVHYIQQVDASSLAMYSRSQLGYSDLGTNLARLQRWLVKLERCVAPARDPQRKLLAPARLQ